MIEGGLKQSTSVLAGDGFLTLKNVSRYSVDSLSLRSGLADRLNQGGRVMAPIIDSSNNSYILHVNGSNLTYTSTVFDSDPTTLESDLSATSYGSFAGMDGRLYYADGTVFKYVDNSLASGDAGITAPTGTIGEPTNAASSGSISAGVHLYRYRYADSATGYLSDPSGAISYTHSESDRATFTVTDTGGGGDIIRSTQTKADKLILEMTAAGGSTFYDVAYVDDSGSSIVVSMSDTELREQQRRANGADVGNSPPPLVPIIVTHRNRLFGIGLSGGRTYLYWSGAGKPEGWNTIAEARTIFQDGSDRPTAMFSAYGDLYVFGLRSTVRIAYTNSPATAIVEDMPTDLGAWNSRCVQWVNDAVFGWGPGGIWTLAGMSPRNIDGDVRDALGAINYSSLATDLYHVVYDSEDDAVLFFYPPAGSTDVTGCLVYDLTTKEWRTNDYEQAIIASTPGPSSSGSRQPYLSNANNQTWHLERGVWDGVSSDDPEVITNYGAVLSGATTFSVNETFSDADSVIGALMYRASTAEEFRITDNEVGSVTFTPALASAVADGEEFYLGSYDYRVSPKWQRFPKSDGKSRPSRLTFSFIPDSTTGSKTKLSIYQDFGASAKSFTKNESDVFTNGFEILSTDGQDHADLDISKPFISCPQFSDWGRFWRWSLYGRRPANFHLVDASMIIEEPDAKKIRDE